ncbi:MAG: radical SAM protein [Candidatus Dadabacteria bacterium]|nr:MAG: radical SAM protein [Candidatus Dadabacteria bacterium]
MVAANRCRDPEPVVPLGAALAAEAAESAGWDADLLDLGFAARPVVSLGRYLDRTKPDLVALSVRNLDNNDALVPRSYAPEVRSLVAVCRDRGVPVVLGGPGVSILPGPLLEFSGADWALPGEAEAVFPGFLHRLQDADPPPRGVIFAARRHVATSGVPDLSRWLDLRPYIARMAPGPLQSKRGCPFGCVYCTYPAIEGARYRLRAPEAVAEDAGRLFRKGFRAVELVDSVFNAPRDHAVGVCEALAAGHRQGILVTHDLSPLGLDEALAEAMEAAGFRAVGITAESASGEVLGALGKPFGPEDVARTARVLRSRAMAVLWVMLFGGPGETPETVRESLAFLRSVMRPNDAAWIGVGIRVYPGTPLAELAADEGGLFGDPASVDQPAFYVSPRTPLGWLAQTVGEAARSDPRILWSGVRGRSLQAPLRRIGGWLGAPGPLWRVAPRIRRLLFAAGFR